MPVTCVHTYLVHPRSPDGVDSLAGAAVPLEGKLFALLNEIYIRSDSRCNIDIAFNMQPDGTQYNAVRELVLNYLNEPSLEAGATIARRLGEVTTKRSGLGLLFLISGREDADHKIVISRFPADSGILAEMDRARLTVEFLERVFMKNAHSFKAAAYQGPSLLAGFWEGRAIDRQIGDPVIRMSDYWVRGFLESDFRTTSAAGTRRLALALKAASRAAGDAATKQAVSAAATLAQGLDGQRLSIAEFQRRFELPEVVREAMNLTLKSPQIAEEKFVFSEEEFGRQITFKSIELDNGAILTAQNVEFDKVFEQSPSGEGGRVRYSTEGVVIEQKFLSKV